jgi:Family of unknown function (DUF6643)
MTSPPRGTYGGGYYSSPFFPDTPIYDSLVAERGTPQIAPIRVPSAYDTGSNLPALPAARPALPPVPSFQTPVQGAPAQGGYTGGYQQQGYQQPVPSQNAPTPYIPQQGVPRPAFGQNGTNSAGYPMQQGGQAAYQGPAGYEPIRPAAPRPVAPRPAAPVGYGPEQQRRNLGGGNFPPQQGGYYQGG